MLVPEAWRKHQLSKERAFPPLAEILAELLRHSRQTLVVVGGTWPAPQPFLRIAVNAGAFPLVLLESSALEAEGEALAMGALAACAKKGPPKQKPAIPVAVATARRAAVPIVIPANGIVAPIQTVQVSSQVDGIIRHVYFHEGQDVKQGDIMFEIDRTAYLAAYNQAKATLAKDIATMKYDSVENVRYNELVAAKKVPQALLDKLPPPSSYKNVVFPTLSQQDAYKDTITKHWDETVGANVK